MKIEQKREALKSAYSGDRWIEKVEGMTDEQVTAFYIRLKSQRKV
jgi:hypothetical protein